MTAGPCGPGAGACPALSLNSTAMSRFDQQFRAELGHIADTGGTRRLRALERIGPAAVRRDGRELLDFSSNDYLCLSFSQLLRERSASWAIEFGAGAGASRLVGGSLLLHQQVEAKLAAFKQSEAALIFASGWQANVAVLASLLARNDLVFTDRLAHASLHHGIAAAGAREIRFRHNDLSHLEELLTSHAGSVGQRFIITESVFSMDGDRADVAAIAALAQRFNAFFYLDEAHATGVLGAAGRGIADGCADLVMGTFSKAMGCFGAYIAGTITLCDYLIHQCSGFVHTTAPPPAMLGAIDAAIDLVPQMDAERSHLARLAARLRAGLEQLGISFGASSTQIVPLIIGEAEAALRVAAALEKQGMLGVAIRPPSVPPGTSRIRIALSAAHQDQDIDRLLNALESARG